MSSSLLSPVLTPSRKKMLCCMVYFVESFMFGFAFNMRNAQVVFYLQEIKAENIPLYQGFITVASQVPCAFSGLLFGYLCDRYGKASRLILVCNLFMFVGNLIYAIPSSANWMLLGECIDGVGVGFNVIRTSEVARMFDGKVLTKALSIINLGMAIGLVVGPAMNFALVNVDLNYGRFWIHPTNAPSFLTCLLLIIVQGLVLLCLYNSEDIAKEESNEEETTMLIGSDQGSDKPTSNHHKDYCSAPSRSTKSVRVTRECNAKGEIGITAKLRLLLTNLDLPLVYFCTFFWSFVLVSMEAMIPLVSAEWLGFNGTKLSITYIISGFVFVIANSLLALVQHKINDFYTTCVVATIQLIIPGFLFWIYMLQKSGAPAVPQYYSWVAIGSMTWILEDVLTRSLSSRIAPLEIQGFAEGFRTIPRALGFLLAGALVSIWFHYVNVSSIVVFSLGAVVVVLLISRCRHLLHPVRMAIECRLSVIVSCQS